jgi:hypothetical protein
MRVVLHIERLVLDCLPANIDAGRVRAEIERELSDRLKDSPSRPWQAASIDRASSAISHGQTLDTSSGIAQRVSSAVQSAIAATQPRAIPPIHARHRGEPR